MIEKNTTKTKVPDEEELPVTNKMRKPLTKQMFINRALLIVAIVGVALGGYFYYKLYNLQKNPNAENAKEAKDLLAKVAEIYLIPTGEEPTIATVSDPTALKNQSFFTASQKGDKVLIFTLAGKAVLYRPSIDKIIETAPINNTKNDQTTKVPEKKADTTKDAKDKTF